MSSDGSSQVAPEANTGLDAERIGAWLADALGTGVADVRIGKLAGGHSSGAWRLDVVAGGRPTALVLKAPEVPSIVHRRDAGREARIIDAAGRAGAPLPTVLAIDTGGAVVGRPCFALELVDGRSVPDASAAGCHGDGWFRDADAGVRRSIWHSFHDALAALHRVDAATVPDASHGPGGVVDVLAYWREALLDAAAPEIVPRQLALLDWLRANVPPGADDAPALCMGDARLVNGLVRGEEVRALVDFEVAYVGNPAADIGYSLFFDGMQRQQTDRPLDGLPSPDDTWARWSAATGRAADDRAYWTAFGATVLCVTATRAMLQWGFSDTSVEADNTIVADWEDAVGRAGG